MSRINPNLKPVVAGQISKILEESRTNNARDGITGLLVLHDQNFFQVLEGGQTLVESCFHRIQSDFRHHNVSLIWEGHVERQVFPDWEMGYAAPSELELQSRESLQSLANLKRNRRAILAGPSLAAQLADWVLSDIPDIQ